MLHHRDFLEEDSFKPGSVQWEAPPRIPAILEALQNDRWFRANALSFKEQFEPATQEMLERAHSKQYINFVRDLAKEVADKFLSPVPFTPKVQRKVCIPVNMWGLLFLWRAGEQRRHLELSVACFLCFPPSFMVNLMTMSKTLSTATQLFRMARSLLHCELLVLCAMQSMKLCKSGTAMHFVPCGEFA